MYVCCLYITCITASAADTAWCRNMCGTTSIIVTGGLRDHFIGGAVHMLNWTLRNKCLWGIEVWLKALNFYTRWRWVVDFTLLTTLNPRLHPLDKRLGEDQSRTGTFGEDAILLLFSGIESSVFQLVTPSMYDWTIRGPKTNRSGISIITGYFAW